MQRVTAFYGGVYEIEVVGYGCRTEEEARSKADASVARWNAIPYRCGPGEFTHREHRAVFTTGCGACGVSGVVPGYKRKKCPVCAGRGTVDGHSVSVAFAEAT